MSHLGIRSLASPLRQSIAVGTGATANVYATRSLFTRAGTRLPTNKASLTGYCALAISLPFSLGFSSKAAAPDAQVDSQSSSMFREKSPAALRPQATTLMFASIKQETQTKWYDWVGYFREAGFDCVLVNLDYTDKSEKQTAQVKDILADELGSQIRLSSLQRSPLLFIHTSDNGSTSKSIDLLHSHLHSRPQISGVVIVPSQKGAENVVDQVKMEEIKKKLGGRVLLLESDDENALRESERWLIERGF
ncbi:unnamed protein product [Sympodiomycopsis kandeliae]